MKNHGLSGEVVENILFLAQYQPSLGVRHFKNSMYKGLIGINLHMNQVICRIGPCGKGCAGYGLKGRGIQQGTPRFRHFIQGSNCRMVMLGLMFGIVSMKPYRLSPPPLTEAHRQP